jgi:hypothetical protein
MKKHFLKLTILSAILLAFAFEGSAQVYVHVRPSAPAVAHRPPPPGHGYVWINEDWNPRGANYEYAGGHWAKPAYAGATWAPGRWRRHGRDWEWVPGRWRKR